MVTTATTNLFGHPVFKDGAFTANDRQVRRFALAKVMRNLDLAAELGARCMCSGAAGRARSRGPARTSARRWHRYKEALDVLCQYVMDHGYRLRFAIEPKPNEPRGDILLPTAGHALAFITELEHPELVGINPEVGHEEMAGLNYAHAHQPGAVARQAVPHRPQRPARPPLRPGPAVRRRQRPRRVLGRRRPRGRRLRRRRALRLQAAAHRRRRRRLGLRRRVHAQLPDPARQSPRVPRRPRSPGRPGSRPGRPNSPCPPSPPAKPGAT